MSELKSLTGAHCNRKCKSVNHAISFVKVTLKLVNALLFAGPQSSSSSGHALQLTKHMSCKRILLQAVKSPG